MAQHDNFVAYSLFSSYEGPDIDLNTPESVVGVPAEDQRQPPK